MDENPFFLLKKRENSTINLRAAGWNPRFTSKKGDKIKHKIDE